MKTAVFASLIATAAAFAPAQNSASSSALAASPFAGEVGAQMPLGFFDPLGLSADVDKEEFDRLRWVELKHGRVAMLAVVGYLVTKAGVRFPGAEDIPSGFDALPAVPGMVWAQMIATWAMMEAANRDQKDTTGVNSSWTGSTFPGDFRNGALDFGWDKLDEKTKLRKRSVELNNGRAAQMGILGLMVHEQLGNVGTILPLA
jgi:hypothetical protein